jgi:hypothetical protein
MDTLTRILVDPRTLPALVAFVAAATALLRAETARIDAANALARAGGKRNVTLGPPAGSPERRRS